MNDEFEGGTCPHCPTKLPDLSQATLDRHLRLRHFAETPHSVPFFMKDRFLSFAYRGGENPSTPKCPFCNEEIRYCLDMFTFTTGFDREHPFTLAHAHCIWKKDAFDREKGLASSE